MQVVQFRNLGVVFTIFNIILRWVDNSQIDYLWVWYLRRGVRNSPFSRKADPKYSSGPLVLLPIPVPFHPFACIYIPNIDCYVVSLDRWNYSSSSSLVKTRIYHASELQRLLLWRSLHSMVDLFGNREFPMQIMFTLSHPISSSTSYKPISYGTPKAIK